jgi:hypothetical protein
MTFATRAVSFSLLFASTICSNNYGVISPLVLY